MPRNAEAPWDSGRVRDLLSGSHGRADTDLQVHTPAREPPPSGVMSSEQAVCHPPPCQQHALSSSRLTMSGEEGKAAEPVRSRAPRADRSQDSACCGVSRQDGKAGAGALEPIAHRWRASSYVLLPGRIVRQIW